MISFPDLVYVLETLVAVVAVDNIEDVEYFPETPHKIITSVGLLEPILMSPSLLLFDLFEVFECGRNDTFSDMDILLKFTQRLLIFCNMDRLQLNTAKIRTPCRALTILLTTRYFQTLSLPYIQDKVNPTNSKK